jgi:RHS repeat-associated protein
VGNITKLTTLSTAGTDTQSFGYDHLNRLVSASGSGVAPTYSDAYAYNQIGNITSFDGAAYTYSAAHKHAVATANGITYSYDANGNMTFRDASGAANDYTQIFNVENELTSVVNSGNTTSFTYDAAGIRVKTIAPNGVITDYPFPGYEVENPTGSATVRLTFSIAGQAVALKVMGSSTATYYLYNDHLGSVAAMSTNGGGTVNGSTARYYPFGAWRTEPTANLTDRGFTGHLHNNLGSGADNLGLVYMNARWYLPALGRFISADTLVPDPMNPQASADYAVGALTAGVSHRLSSPRGRQVGPTIDSRTGEEVGRFIVDPNGNAMIEPIRGSTVPAGRDGVDTHTTYSNGSNYHRLNPFGHPNNPTPHAHGHLLGPGPNPDIKGQGSSIDVFGKIVPWNSADAHWPISH